MARVLITGATGFLGAEIARRVVAAGHDVVLFRRATSSLARIADLPAAHAIGDVTDRASLDRAMQGAALCIHAAGDTSYFLRDRARLSAVNVGGVRNVVDAARAAGVRRLVHTSSVAAIGYDPGGQPVDERATWNWPRHLPYMETKRDGERIALGAASDHFEVIALNPSTVLGPGCDEQLPRDVRARKIPAVPSGGMTICDVTDIATAHVKALTRGKSGERYILGGTHVTHRDLLTALAAALDVPPPRHGAPGWVTGVAGGAMLWLERGGLDLRTAAAMVRLARLGIYHSSEKAIEQLGYRSRPLSEIIGRTATSYLAR